jgi:allophanate hydrolase subunit 2
MGGDRLDSTRELPSDFKPNLEKAIQLRALPGPQDDFFDEGLRGFFSSEFTVSGKADRMGYRLEGRTIELREDLPTSIISEPSLPGGIQVPADGQPIILLVEQTVGGYAKIATVVTPDLDLVAQARPGDVVRFNKVDLVGAHEAHRKYQDRLEKIRSLWV